MTESSLQTTGQTEDVGPTSELSEAELANRLQNTNPSELAELFQRLPNPLQKRLIQMAAPLLLVPDDVQESLVGFIKEAVRQMQTK